MKNVLILFGGRSVEHDISIITGLGVLNNISHAYKIIAVYIDKNGQWWTGEKLSQIKSFQPFNTKKLQKCALRPGESNLIICGHFRTKRIPVFCVVNCLHGHDGEDGAVEGLLQLCDIPQTSPNILSSALCMDKTLTKQIMAYNKIKIVEYVAINKLNYQQQKENIIAEIDKRLGFPCIVKPNSLGSSIGVNIAQNKKECENIIETALCFDDDVLIEKFLANNKELNIAMMQDNNSLLSSNIEEVCLKNNVYDFNNKYKAQNIKREVPANIEEKLKNKIIKTAEQAYKILKCSGVVRFDFLYAENTLYLNEVNTIPGSLAGYLFKEPKVAYNLLIDKLIKNAINKHLKQKEKTLVFESDVLKNVSQDSFKMTK